MSRTDPYRPRHPERTPFYQCLEDYWDEFQESYPYFYEAEYGPWRPVLEKTVQRFLECGLLRHGFARLKCEGCPHQALLAFSCKTRYFGSSGKWGGGTWFGAFRIPNLVPRSLVNIVGCSSRGRGNCGKLRATSNWASKPVIRSFPSAVRTVEKQLRALASSPSELLVFPRFA